MHHKGEADIRRGPDPSDWEPLCPCVGYRRSEAAFLSLCDRVPPEQESLRCEVCLWSSPSEATRELNPAVVQIKRVRLPGPTRIKGLQPGTGPGSIFRPHLLVAL